MRFVATALYIICYAFAASAVIFYFVYVPLLGKAGLYLSHRNGAFQTNVIVGRIIAFRKDVRVSHSDNALSYMQLEGFARALFTHNL